MMNLSVDISLSNDEYRNIQDEIIDMYCDPSIIKNIIYETVSSNEDEDEVVSSVVNEMSTIPFITDNYPSIWKLLQLIANGI